MKQNNSGLSKGTPVAQKKNAATMKENNGRRSQGLLSRSKALLTFALMLFIGVAQAQIASYVGTGGTSTSISYATHSSGTTLQQTGFGSATPCGSGGLSGLTNNGVTTYSSSHAHVYFTVTPAACYSLTVTSFTCKLRRSASGLQKVRMAWSSDGGTTWNDDGVDQAPDNASCGAGSTVFSWNTHGGVTPLPSTGGSILFALYPYAPGSSGGVIQVNAITVGGTVSSAGACGSVATGTVTPTTSNVCGGAGSAVALTLSGATTGCGMAYQWQSDAGGSYADIAGATNTTYTTAVGSPAVTTTVNYQVISTCTVSSVTATSASGAVTVNPTPNPGTITGAIATTIGSTNTYSVTGASSGGSIAADWTSSNLPVGTIDISSAVFTGVNAGGTNIIYTVTDYGTSLHCAASTSLNVGVIYSGDLAIYEGRTDNNGHGVTVTPGYDATNETVSALTNTGYGSTTQCGTGGSSGLTESTTITSYSTSGPHVSYIITAAGGKSLNANKFYVSTRSSSNGPTLARLAYRVNGGAWKDEGVDHVLATNGSCGSHTNSWSWVPPTAENGVNTIEAAIYTYSATSTSGTLQIAQLEVIGSISSSATCTATPTPGVITPTLTVVCASGYANMVFAGNAGPGISYQWEANINGAGYAPISGASNIYYTSPVYATSPTNIEYHVISTCSAVLSPATSAVSSFSVIPMPGVITLTSGTISPVLEVGAAATFTCSPTGGTWTSEHFSVASIDASSGTITGLMPGITKITYNSGGGIGCISTTSVTVAEPATIALYEGTGGNSVATIPVTSTDVSPNNLEYANFGMATLCSSGGLSGLTVNTVVATYSDPLGAAPYVVFTITPVAGAVSSIHVTSVTATVRTSASGPQSTELAYSTNGGLSWSHSGDLGTDAQSCGVSTYELNWPVSFSTPNPVLVAVVPYASLSNGGVFQVNTIDVTGCVLGTIQDANTGRGLEGEIYNISCGNTSLSCNPGGGTWSSSDMSVATTDPSSGDLFFVSEGVATITYTSTCSSDIATATFTVTSSGYSSCDGTTPRHASPAPGVTPSTSADIKLYPNPTSTILNISAAQKINISVLSMDGRTLINQKNAKAIDVSNLANGLYMINIYDQSDKLLKVGKFTKAE